MSSLAHPLRLRLSSILLIFLCSLASISQFEAYGAPPSASAGQGIEIQVDSSSGGIVISPGMFPNLSGDLDSVQNQVADRVVSKTKTVAQTITAVCAIICLVFFFINVAKLATSGSIAFQRRMALIGILWSGIALALFGGAWVVISFFWSLLTT